MVLERQAQQIRKAKFAKESKEVEQLMVGILSSFSYAGHEYLSIRLKLTGKSLTIHYASVTQEMNSFILQQRRMRNVQSKKKQEERKHAIEKQSR